MWQVWISHINLDVLIFIYFLIILFANVHWKHQRIQRHIFLALLVKIFEFWFGLFWKMLTIFANKIHTIFTVHFIGVESTEPFSEIVCAVFTANIILYDVFKLERFFYVLKMLLLRCNWKQLILKYCFELIVVHKVRILHFWIYEFSWFQFLYYHIFAHLCYFNLIKFIFFLLLFVIKNKFFFLFVSAQNILFFLLYIGLRWIIATVF